MKLRVQILIALNIVFLLPASSQRIKNIPAEKPKLIVWMVVDQMRYDYLNRFNTYFSEGGFKKMIENGAVCTNAHFGYIFNQAGVGEATMVTGSNPVTHGIVSEYWYLRLQDQEIHCTSDPKYKTVGIENQEGERSPAAMSASTIGDELKLSNESKSKIFSVALEPSSSIMLAGHAANGAYWYSEESGNWISSSYYMDSLPAWANEFNAKQLQNTYLQKEWNLLLSLEDYSKCLPDKNKYETGIQTRSTFPYDLSNLSNLKRKNPDYSVLKTTPWGNLYTKDFAISCIMNEELGKDEFTDIITIGFNSTEEIGLRFGPKSLEVQDAFVRLDREIEHFMDFLDDYVGKENVLIILTSNHGVSEIPEYLNSMKIPADYFNSKSAVQLLKSYLDATYGRGKWIEYYYKQQVFLNRELIEDSKLNLADIQQKSADFLLQFSGISNTVTATTLQTTNFTGSIFEKMQNSYNQERSGDILINLKPGWIEKSNRCTDSNTGYAYCTHVPVIFYGWKTGRKKIHDPVSMTDIAPTLSALLEIAYPNSCTGNPINEILK